MNEEPKEQNAPFFEGLTHTESVAKIAEALSAAQGEMGGAIKGAVNPHYKSSYADLASIIRAIREPLANHGIAHVQSPGYDGNGDYLDTMLIHSSGEWIKGRIRMKPVKDDPQGIGSLITYARRYSLQSMTGLESDDDDGNGASHAPRENIKPAPAKYGTAANDPAVQQRIQQEDAEFAKEEARKRGRPALDVAKTAAAMGATATQKPERAPVADPEPEVLSPPAWVDEVKDWGTDHKGKTYAQIALRDPAYMKKLQNQWKPKPDSQRQLDVRAVLDESMAKPVSKADLETIVAAQEGK